MEMEKDNCCWCIAESVSPQDVLPAAQMPFVQDWGAQRGRIFCSTGELLCSQAGSGPFVPPVRVPRARAQHSTNPRLVSGTDCSASP